MGVPIVHFEIGCRDTAKTGKFYCDLFDWKISDFGGTQMVDTGTKEGIMGHINSLGHEPHNYTTFYAIVDEIEPYLEKIKKLGGSVLIPKTEVPGAGWFAWFKDLDGNVLGLWKTAMPAKK